MSTGRRFLFATLDIVAALIGGVAFLFMHLQAMQCVGPDGKIADSWCGWAFLMGMYLAFAVGFGGVLLIGSEAVIRLKWLTEKEIFGDEDAK